MVTEAERKQVKQNQIVIGSMKQAEHGDQEELGWSRWDGHGGCSERPSPRQSHLGGYLQAEQRSVMNAFGDAEF